jgi:LacI family transcriptional regulator
VLIATLGAYLVHLGAPEQNSPVEVDPYTTLQNRILSGEYRPGEWLPPERQLASEMGVNRRTVHRVILRLAETGLVDCQPGRRTVVRAPVTTKTHYPTIALLMGNEPMYHAFQVVLHGCEPVLRTAGYRILFMDTWGQTVEVAQGREREALANLIDHPVDGVIFWCQSPEASATQIRMLQESGVACVAIDREIPSLDTDFVGIDNVDAGRCAVEHLLALGHRRIALATGQESTSSVQGREAGYREALARHGIPLDESLIYRIHGPIPESEARSKAAEIASAVDRPTAIFAVNDVLALRLATFLREDGLRIPEDVAVVGFDNMEALSLMRTGLTTTDQPYESVGRQAARLICRRIATPDAPIQHVLLPTSLVIRGSTVRTPAQQQSMIAPAGKHEGDLISGSASATYIR